MKSRILGLTLFAIVIGFLFYGQEIYTYNTGTQKLGWVDNHIYSGFFEYENQPSAQIYWILLLRCIYIMLYFICFNEIIHLAFRRKCFNQIGMVTSLLLIGSYFSFLTLRILASDFYFHHHYLFLSFKHVLDAVLTRPPYHLLMLIIFIYLDREWRRG